MTSLFFALVLISSAAWAATPGFKGTPQDALVAEVSGEVLVRPDASASWRPIRKNESLSSGSEIATKADGQVALVLDPGREVQLKPDSNLILKDLSKDLKTGARQDILESAKGKIRASIRRLGKGSRFEVRSPTGLAGVRGTVMYLDISVQGMAAFFEAGPGFLGSGISREIQEVGAGKNSFVDSQGALAQPADTTPEQRQDMETGWIGEETSAGEKPVTPQEERARRDADDEFRKSLEEDMRRESQVEPQKETPPEQQEPQEPPHEQNPPSHDSHDHEG